jgi:hypothetical protein
MRPGGRGGQTCSHEIAVERREAQRPDGGSRKPATAGRARLGMDSQTHPDNRTDLR